MSGEAARIVRRGTILFWLAVLSGALLAFELLSGVLLWFVIPSGQGRGASGSATALGLDRHLWLDLHDWAALMLTAVVIAHIAMHWKWVVRQTRAYFGGRRPAAASSRVSGGSA